MRRVFGSRVRRTLLTVAVAGPFALAPSVATGMTIVSADGYAKFACDFYAQWPDESTLDGMMPEAASQLLEAGAVPLGGYVDCTFRREDGEVFFKSRVHAMPPAGVIACYTVALSIAAASWLTRPKLWVQRR